MKRTIGWLIVLVSFCCAISSSQQLPTTKSDAEAVLRNATTGDVKSQHIAGLMYLEGRAVAKDLPSAFRWFKKAADAGYPAAQYDLAVMYENGEGTVASCTDAALWYERAAQKNHLYAIENLLAIYERGACLKHDDIEIARLTRQAAEIGSPTHQLNLGSLYAMGRGVPKDDEKAFKWFSQAAEQGQPVAQFMVGQWYRDGRGGIAQNYVVAYKWFTLAVSGGNQIDGRTFVKPKMTAEQIADAQQQADEWLSKHQAKTRNPVH